MFINAIMGRVFACKWDAMTWTPSDCVWMVPGTFDANGEPLPFDLLGSK